MRHSADALNTVRDKAFEDFKAQGFPTRKVERYTLTFLNFLNPITDSICAGSTFQ